jgi:alginate O-acetyltransferase complex protein AlgI
MVFNSWVFVAFLLIVLTLDGFLQHRTTARKWMLLIASYVFYGAWSVKFLALILFSTVMDYWIARQMPKSTKPRTLMLISLLCNLGILAFFKYVNFFIESINSGLAFGSISFTLHPLEIVLPVGISFFTFQALSYTIDVYRGDLKPRDSLLDYALFIAFFPQLVAGPIVRAVEFFKELDLPRPASSREINLGLVLIVLGLVKKMCVADGLSQVVDPVFNNPLAASTLDSWLAVYAYAVQIYCDFSGYTDTAIGTALLFGFRFPDNFNYPYAATSFQEFWRRWHMTLSRFLRDYLYIALGGNRFGPTRTQVNLMLTMLLGGLWHGAAWTFVFWGFLHGAYLVVERFAMQLFPRFYASQNWLVLALRWAIVFHAVCFAWIFFRAPSFAAGFQVVKNLTGFSSIEWSYAPVMLVLLGTACAHYLGNRFQTKQKLADGPNWLCGLALGMAFLAMVIFTPATHQPFIYFQF